MIACRCIPMGKGFSKPEVFYILGLRTQLVSINGKIQNTIEFAYVSRKLWEVKNVDEKGRGAEAER